MGNFYPERTDGGAKMGVKIYTAEEERDFLKNHLGPVMEKSGHGDKNIVVWDHNRDLMAHRANVIFGDPEASKYAWGIGYHWYETWYTECYQHCDGFENMHENLVPTLFIMIITVKIH